MYQPFSSSPSLVLNSHLFVGGAEVGRGDVVAGRVRDDVGDRDREQDGERGEEHGSGDQQPAAVAPPEPVVATP